MVSSLAACSAKCIGIQISPALTRSVTHAVIVNLPRRVLTFTFSPVSIPSFAPSATLISTNASGSRSFDAALWRVIVPTL